MFSCNKGFTKNAMFTIKSVFDQCSGQPKNLSIWAQKPLKNRLVLRIIIKLRAASFQNNFFLMTTLKKMF